MANTITARVQKAAVQAGPISKANLNGAQLNITDSGGPNSTFLEDWVVYGTSTGAPATFAGLANPLSVQIVASASVACNQSTPAIYTVVQNGLNFSAMTEGDTVWACYFKQTAAPATTDVPSATVSLGALGA